jgi:Tfp pilus assembly protein PilE
MTHAIIKINRQTVLGVTLIEIMLAIAIASLIVLNSIRFYKTTVAHNQALGLVQYLQLISAVADSYAANSGYTAFTTSAIPDNLKNSQWGAITVTASTQNSYSLSFANITTSTCEAVLNLLKNSNYSSSNNCSSAGEFVVTYTAS